MDMWRVAERATHFYRDYGAQTVNETPTKPARLLLLAVAAVVATFLIVGILWLALGQPSGRPPNPPEQSRNRPVKQPPVSEAPLDQPGPQQGKRETDQKSAETPPAFSERTDERRRMVTEQIESRGVTDKTVLQAMRRVPRHAFVSEGMSGNAYGDSPLPIGHGQTISQPYIVAYMTEQLELEPGEKVLEIGTGSGYQAAVLAEITSKVYTIEIIKELAVQASKRLKRLGYRNVKSKQGDGYFAWEEHAPFDAIIVTCSAGHIPPPLLKQLAPGGHMVIPVGSVYETQSLIKVRKNAEGRIRSQELMAVRFVPMTGRAQEGR